MLKFHYNHYLFIFEEFNYQDSLSILCNLSKIIINLLKKKD